MRPPSAPLPAAKWIEGRLRSRVPGTDGTAPLVETAPESFGRFGPVCGEIARLARIVSQVVEHGPRFAAKGDRLEIAAPIRARRHGALTGAAGKMPILRVAQEPLRGAAQKWPEVDAVARRRGRAESGRRTGREEQVGPYNGLRAHAAVGRDAGPAHEPEEAQAPFVEATFAAAQRSVGGGGRERDLRGRKPPSSETRTTRVFRSRSRARRCARTRPTLWARLSTIAAWCGLAGAPDTSRADPGAAGWAGGRPRSFRAVRAGGPKAAARLARW